MPKFFNKFMLGNGALENTGEINYVTRSVMAKRKLLKDETINNIATDAESNTETREVLNEAGEKEPKEISDEKEKITQKECKDDNSEGKMTNDESKKVPYIHSNFDTTIWDREIHEIDEMPLTVLTDDVMSLSQSQNKFLKNNHAMLWHARFGHASVT